MGRMCGRRTVKAQVCHGMHAMMMQWFCAIIRFPTSMLLLMCVDCRCC
jgi:hypothetical protein